MQRGNDIAHARFNGVFARSKQSEIPQGFDDPDRTVPTHPEVTDVIEENHPGSMGWILRWDHNRSYHDFRTARLKQQAGPQKVKVAAHRLKPLCDTWARLPRSNRLG
jgi:hypothetical protein